MTAGDGASARGGRDASRAAAALRDPATGLPLLAAVAGELVERMAAGERLGVLFLDLRGEERLEEVYGWAIFDSVLRQVADGLRALQGSVLSPGDRIVLSAAGADEFVVVTPAREADTLDHNRLLRLRDEVVEELSGRLQVQFDREVPRPLALHSAAVPVRRDHRVRLERALYRAVDEARGLCRQEREQRTSQRSRELKRILARRDLVVRYQPIYQLADRALHGYESLTSPPPGSAFRTPETLFGFAEASDLLWELESLCRSEAVRRAQPLVAGRRLFLNVSARTLAEPERFTGALVQQLPAAGLAPEAVVLEITERAAITAWRDFHRSLNHLRERGFAVAVDDVGAGYSSLQSVAEIEPNYLKFDLSLVRDLHASRTKRNLLEGLAALAQKIGAQVIAEGVEQEAEWRALGEMGIDFAQGFWLGAPEPPEFWQRRLDA